MHQVQEMLRDLEEGESMEGISLGGTKTAATAAGPEGVRDPPLPMEMKILDGKGHLGLE